MKNKSQIDLNSLAPNSTYPKGGGPRSADSFVVAESSVLRLKFSGEIPPFGKLQNVIG